MGFNFRIRFTNQVAYFTTDMPSLICPASQLVGFFRMLNEDHWRLLTSRAASEWLGPVRTVAENALNIALHQLNGRSANEPPHDHETVQSAKDPLVSIDDVFAEHTNVLKELKKQLGSFDLFALGVADRKRSQEVTNLLTPAACDERYEKVLFLIPDQLETEARNLDFYNPFPGASEICRYPERWPGLLFWQKGGDSLFLPIHTALDYLPAIVANKGRPLNVLKEQIPHVEARPSVRLLHLSDLHCGRRETRRNEMHLLTSISQAFRDKYDKIIISGDLFDSPFVWKWEEYKNFRQMLQLLTKHKPIEIKGNHDVRVLGNAIWRIGTLFKAAGEIEQTPLIVDPQLKCVFFCFNSAKSGNWARGEVSIADLRTAATDFQVQAAGQPEIKDWLRIAVVHHHPFKFDAESEGWTARMLKALHIPEGAMVDMNESERFVRWCAEWRVQLILFGHRHVQRKITKIERAQDETGIHPIEITAIGCGTSLGAENVPLSFNIVTWDPAERVWTAAFYLDDSGSKFREVRDLDDSGSKVREVRALSMEL